VDEDEAQLYIRNRYPGFENRFIKPVGTTCAGTIYHDMVLGNSPGNVRGLDSFGFADLDYAMCFDYALAWHCPYGDARRIFGQGTPKEVRHLMQQTWTVVFPHQCAHHGGHLGVGAAVRQDHQGQGHYRPRRELPDRPPCAKDAQRGATQDKAAQARPQEHAPA